MVSASWKALSHEQKEEYHAIALQDRNRFEEEKLQFKGSWTIQSNNEVAPKRPPAPFISYLMANRREVRGRNPDLTSDEITRIIARMWKSAPLTIHQSYRAQYDRALEQYKTNMQRWNADKEEKEAGSKEKDRRPAAPAKVMVQSNDSLHNPKIQPQTQSLVQHQSSNHSARMDVALSSETNDRFALESELSQHCQSHVTSSLSSDYNDSSSINSTPTASMPLFAQHHAPSMYYFQQGEIHPLRIQSNTSTSAIQCDHYAPHLHASQPGYQITLNDVYHMRHDNPAIYSNECMLDAAATATTSWMSSNNMDIAGMSYYQWQSSLNDDDAVYGRSQCHINHATLDSMHAEATTMNDDNDTDDIDISQFLPHMNDCSPIGDSFSWT
jgi:hypothetical protein